MTVKSGLVLNSSLALWWSILLLNVFIEANYTTTKTTPTTVVSHSTTPSSADKLCPLFNNSCEKCVQSAKCLYCFKDKTCKPYPVGSLLPSSSVCPLNQARWSKCFINFEALLIAMGVLAGLLLFSICMCIYCCCCRKSDHLKYMAEELKFEHQREERRQKAAERRAERQSKNDEIRKKYGLMKEENPYRRFDA